jgi:hypothetical protein
MGSKRRKGEEEKEIEEEGRVGLERIKKEDDEKRRGRE